MNEELMVASIGLGGIVKNRLVEGVELSDHCRFVGAYDPNIDDDGVTFLSEHGTLTVHF